MNTQLFFSFTRDYLQRALSPQASPNTVEAYADALTIFRRYVSDVRGIPLNKFTFDDCTYGFVLDYRNWLLEDANRSPQTANHRLAALKSYLRYAASRDVSLQQIHLSVSDVPAAPAPTVIRDVISDSEGLRAFLSAPPNTRIGRRDTALLVVLFDCGVRVSELTAIRLQDMNLSACSPNIRIHGKGNKERPVPVSDQTKLLLNAYLEERAQDCGEQTDFLFYTKSHGVFHRMSRRNVERIVQKYGELARIDHPNLPERITPHTLRRSRGTMLYQDGAPIELVAAFLGHASIQTTTDHYAVRSFEQIKGAMEQGGGGTVIKQPEKPEWPDDNEEFAKLCGLR